MKKIISGILTAAMLLGMLTFGAVAENDTALKFDDTVCAEGGGTHGYAHYQEGDAAFDGLGLAISMDFTMGRRGPCEHPIDPLAAHSSKLNFTLGSSDNEYKYFGYNADQDFFYLATSTSGPMGGETTSGYNYLATSETGLIKYGVEYNLVFMFDFETGFKVLLDGECILEFDLYEDLVIGTVWAYSHVLMYSTHITYYLDNFNVYKADAIDFEAGTITGDPIASSDFNDLKTVTKDVVDGEGNVTGTQEVLDVPGWSFLNGTEAFSCVDPATEIYGQPNNAAGNLPNLVFEDGVKSTSTLEFKVALTMKNNTGIDKLELDLMNDPYISVVSVEAADGYTATLGKTDANGLTRLTITGSKCKNEAVATITYLMSELAAENDFYYGYGAKIGTQTGKGGEGMDSFVITGGQTKVWNYTVGDVNGDGNHSLVDVALIMKNSAKWDLPAGVFVKSMDVNGDGRVNNMDASYYLRHLAGWEGYEALPAVK